MAAVPTRRRRTLALVAAVGAVISVVGSFLPWISADTESGGDTRISGWGAISGDNPLAGANLNDVLDGVTSYRPGLIGVLFALLALTGAIAVAATAGGPRPHRVTAAVLMLCGGLLTGWGLWRWLYPGAAGVFEPGEASAGAGPWFTLAGGLLCIAAAVPNLGGRIDPPVESRRGIQARR